MTDLPPPVTLAEALRDVAAILQVLARGRENQRFIIAGRGSISVKEALDAADAALGAGR